MYTREEAGFGRAIARKSYEVGYALVRISRNTSRERFADHLEDLAIQLLRATTEHSSVTALNVLEAIQQIVRLGADTGVLNASNGELIVHESKQLSDAIGELGRVEGFPLFTKEEDLTGVFTEFPELDSFFRDKGMRVSYGEKLTSNIDDYSGLDDLGETEDESEIIVDEPVQEAQIPEKKKISEKKGQNTPSQMPEHGQGGQVRQSKILERIRQIEQCKMKDLQESLPGVSERTIRYDLQNLIEQGLVERIGSSGPATHYQIRQ